MGLEQIGIASVKEKQVSFNLMESLIVSVN